MINKLHCYLFEVSESSSTKPMVVRLVNLNELESESWLKNLGFINPTVEGLFTYIYTYLSVEKIVIIILYFGCWRELEHGRSTSL